VRERGQRQHLLGDEDLIRLVGAGDAFAFSLLYERHSRTVYSVARRLSGGDEREAEDLAQEAFLKVWRSAGSYRAERGGARKWIFSVLRNQGVDQLRATATRSRMQEKVEAYAPRSEASEAFAQVWHGARQGQVREALDALPHSQQQVLELAYFSELTHPEIAKRLGVPLGTVKGRMRLGLEKLRNNGSELRDLAAG
jgi:RNA polymerase sigma-70 factor, ECF subfamily